MPKLGQPTSLKKMAIDFLLEHVVDCCDRLSVAGSLDELDRGVGIIKQEVFSRIPYHQLGEFCEKFFNKFSTKYRSDSHKTAALEFIMDMEITGLRCPDGFVTLIEPSNRNRVKEIEELNFNQPWIPEPINLDNFCLKYLTSFVCSVRCTDYNLRVIGKNCLKLQVLKIAESWRVTDEGLRALSRCSELRVVDITRCTVSRDGQNLFLSVHENIEEFYIEVDIDLLFDLDPMVCSKITRLILIPHRFLSQKYLRVVVEKFPNLTHIEICSVISVDLDVLKSLGKLKGLSLYCQYQDRREIVLALWNSVEKLFKSIGTNIKSLVIAFDLAAVRQRTVFDNSELDMIFENCPNIEYLDFRIRVRSLMVIPPFSKLKYLAANILPSPDYYDNGEFDFRELVELETLSLYCINPPLKSMLSIILDHVRFPKLSVIEIAKMGSNDLAAIKRIVRTNNLDLEIKTKESRKPNNSNEWSFT